MSDLSHCPVVLVLFAMDGCPHCDEFAPRFERMIGAFQSKGWPFVFYDGRAVARGQIPILVLDGASQDPSIDSLAAQHAIEGMPTTLVLRRSGEAIKLEGAVDDRALYDALVAACEASC